MMRHLLIFLMVGLLGLPARATVEGETLIRQYDDGDTRVTSPAVDVSGTFNHDTMKVSAGYTSDILTSASADVRSYASQGKITDTRNEYTGGFETQIPDGTLGVGYIQSDEKDYHSRIFAFNTTREFFQKNTVMNLAFSNGQDLIEATADPTVHEAMNHQNYSLSLSQIFSRESMGQLVYDFRVENGFLSSPYRKAKVNNGGNLTAIAENHPKTRNRNAIAVKYNRFLPKWKSSSATTYRYYFDSWGVQSHTIEERLTREVQKNLQVSLTVRYYTQVAARFYQDYYGATPGAFYTGNNTLAAYDSYMLGVRPAYEFNDHYSMYAKAEYFYQTFRNATDAGNIATLDDDKPLVIRATVVGLGLNAKF